MTTTIKNHQYLFELGCEELPAGFLSTVEHELKTRLEAMLLEQRLTYSALEIYLTPRRIAFWVKDLADKQPAFEEWVKGPPVKVGLNADGKFTPAAEGFARKQGIDVASLTQKEIDGTPYLSYLRQDAGRTAAEVLSEYLSGVVLSIPGSHFMRWDVPTEGVADVTFSRPIRWVLSLLDEQELPLLFGPLKSGTSTRGHRLLSTQAEISVSHPSQYLAILEANGVVVADHRVRRERIQEQLNALAKEKKIVIPEQAELLDHVNFLVETPKPVMGHFAEDYLKLPKAVITTVMTAHQKYFHALKGDGDALVPGFITIANNPLPEAEATIRGGNEKVLRARLEDAAFFFQEDRKKPLADYVESLKGITFQKNLGTLYDKTQRLLALVDSFGSLGQFSKEVIENTKRAALLSKADLATQMVRELTELQGSVGEVYARLSGEPESVAKAIDEHYLPRYSGDAIPQSDVGLLLSLVDKIDTMVAVFSQKDMKLPTGSKDPMGLRRLCLGLIVTVLERRLPFRFPDALSQAFDNLGKLATEDKVTALARLDDFFAQRLKGYFLDQGYRYDLIDAVFLADALAMADLRQTQARLELFKQALNDMDALKRLYEPANRVARILATAYDAAALPQNVDTSRLENEEEKALAQILTADFDAYLTSSLSDKFSTIATWEPTVTAFFDKTLVNAEDPELKKNRYALLSCLNRAYRELADWTKLAI